MKNEHPLSWEALMRIVLMGLAIFLMWKALDAVVIIIIALVMASALFPLVEMVHKKIKFSLFISTIIVFVSIIVPFALLAIFIIPSFSSQIPEVIAKIGATFNRIPLISNSFNGFDITQYLQTHYNSILSYSKDIIYTIISIITISILTFYFVYDYQRLLNLFLNVFPYTEKEKLKDILTKMADVTGQYIRGNIIISIISSVIIFIGLFFIGIPFALPLAIFSGVMDLLPLVGSTIGAIPAILIAFSLSPMKGFFVILLFLIYQQTENAIISPAIYNKALDLYPALVFLSVIIGASLFGILGAFLALPIAASIPVILNNHKK